MNTYNVPLTQDQRDYLLTLCATVPDDDTAAQEALGECGMDHLEDALRNAETVEEDALQRLEEWIMEGYEDEQDDYRDADISVDNGGICRCALTGWSVKEHGHHFMESHHIGESNTLADAINAALDAVEGGE